MQGEGCRVWSVGCRVWGVGDHAVDGRADLEHGAVALRRTFERQLQEGEFFIGNLLVRIHFIIVMIRWTGLALQQPGCASSLLRTPAATTPNLRTTIQQKCEVVPRRARIEGS